MSGEGEKLGRYTLVRRIGKGGMGEVWLAKAIGAHGFEKQVALKRILPQFSQNAHVVNMLVDEARISVLLNHPNVVQVLELGEEDGDYFIAMEYVDGHALSRLLRKLKKAGRRLDILDACYIAVQLLEGLHAAHVQKDQRGTHAGIIHRDVSPQNVLVSMDGMVKVIDFGIARARERLEVTQGAAVKGKLRYMAPEQLSPKMAKNKPIDHRVDVFAAGIVLYEMLANRQRFPGDAEMEIMDAILKEDTPDLCKEGLIDRELMDILDNALEKNRERRFKDAAAFAAQVRSYLYKRDPGYTAERVAKKMRDIFGDVQDEDNEGERAHSNTSQNKEAEAQEAARRRRAEVSASGDTLHRSEDAQAEDDATRTAFRPAIRERARARRQEEEELEEDEVDAVGGDSVVGEGAPGTMARPRRRKKSRVPAMAFGLFLGVALLVVVFAVVKPRLFDAHPPDGAAPIGVVPPPTPTLFADDNVDFLVEAEPATTRISLADQPDPKYVSPAHIKLKAGQEVELVFEADGYESERHKIVVNAQSPRMHVGLHALPVDLIVHVYPRDAVVTVNGQPLVPGMKVVPGQMVEVRAEHPFAAAPHVVQKVPVAGEPLVVEIRLEEVEQAVRPSRQPHAMLQITSTPSGAEIYVDNLKVRGLTPLDLKVSAGQHRVVVHLDGKGEKVFAVDAADGSTAKLDAKLE